MMPCFLRALLMASAASCCPVWQAGAQSAADSGGVSSGTWQLGVFLGGASRTVTTTNLGITPGRQLAFVGLEAATPILRLGGIHLAYAAQLLPVVALSGRSAPVGYYVPGSAAAMGGSANTGVVPGPYRSYAVGIVPFGLEARTPDSRRLSMFGAIAAGGLLFERAVPVPEATRINFTLEFGGGMRVQTVSGQWLQLGWKHHHLSNAYLARENPGVDADVFYAGFEWNARLPR